MTSISSWLAYPLWMSRCVFLICTFIPWNDDIILLISSLSFQCNLSCLSSTIRLLFREWFFFGDVVLISLSYLSYNFIAVAVICLFVTCSKLVFKILLSWFLIQLGWYVVLLMFHCHLMLCFFLIFNLKNKFHQKRFLSKILNS